ncbi:uncharacterized protein V3H82_011910 [Fundulus diaphanus]
MTTLHLTAPSLLSPESAAESPTAASQATAQVCVGVVHASTPGTEGPAPPTTEGSAPLRHATAEACVGARTAAVRPDAVHSRAASTGVPAAHAMALVCMGVHVPAPVNTEMPAPPVVPKPPEIPVVPKPPEIPIVLKPSAAQPPGAPEPPAEPLPWLSICSCPAHSSSLSSPAPPGRRSPLRPSSARPPPGRPPELSMFFPGPPFVSPVWVLFLWSSGIRP